MGSKGLSACYPRRTFYPLSDTPSTRQYRITIACYRRVTPTVTAQVGVPTRVSQGILLRVLRRVTTRATPTLRTSVTLWEAAAPAKLPAMLRLWQTLRLAARPGGQLCFIDVVLKVVAHPSPTR